MPGSGSDLTSSDDSSSSDSDSDSDSGSDMDPVRDAVSSKAPPVNVDIDVAMTSPPSKPMVVADGDEATANLDTAIGAPVSSSFHPNPFFFLTGDGDKNNAPVVLDVEIASPQDKPAVAVDSGVAIANVEAVIATPVSPGVQRTPGLWLTGNNHKNENPAPMAPPKAPQPRRRGPAGPPKPRTNPFSRAGRTPLIRNLIQPEVQVTLSNLSQAIRFIVANDCLKDVELKPGDAEEERRKAERVVEIGSEGSSQGDDRNVRTATSDETMNTDGPSDPEIADVNNPRSAHVDVVQVLGEN